MDSELNFLEQSDALGGDEVIGGQVAQKKWPKAPFWSGRSLFLIPVFILLICALAFLVNVGRFVNAAMKAGDSLQLAIAHAQDLEFEEAQQEVQIIEDSLEIINNSLWFAGWLRPVPYVGDQVEALTILSDAGVSLASIANEGLSIAHDLNKSVVEMQKVLDDIPGLEKEYTFTTLPDEVRVQILRTLHDIAPELARVSVELDVAQAKLADLEGLSLQEDIQMAVDDLNGVLPIASSVVDVVSPFAQAIGQLAGVDQDRQWLLLFLNNTEMRPGGGFMGSYGLLQVRDGGIVSIETSDTYAIDQLTESDDYIVEPPFAIEQYLGQDTWYFRDANWYPDFEESSKTAVSLLRQEYAFAGEPVPEIHGVIGFTPTVVEAVLDVVGEVEVSGVVFTSDDFTETLEYAVEYGFADRGASWEDRKDIIDDLTNILIDELLSLSNSDLMFLAKNMSDMFTQKQIALTSFDVDTQVVFEDAGWAGAVEVDEYDDFLLVADANMGALKTDHAIERDIKYTVIPDDEGYLAQVDITYEHTGEYDWRTSQYMSYTSILVPSGSELVSTNGENASQVQELGTARFGAYVTLKPGEVETLSFIYKLPESISEAVDGGMYDLSVFKQMGSKQASLTLDLDFDKKLRAAEPGEQEEQYGDGKYYLETELSTDTEFMVQF